MWPSFSREKAVRCFSLSLGDVPSLGNRVTCPHAMTHRLWQQGSVFSLLPFSLEQPRLISPMFDLGDQSSSSLSLLLKQELLSYHYILLSQGTSCLLGCEVLLAPGHGHWSMEEETLGKSTLRGGGAVKAHEGKVLWRWHLLSPGGRQSWSCASDWCWSVLYLGKGCHLFHKKEAQQWPHASWCMRLALGLITHSCWHAEWHSMRGDKAQADFQGHGDLKRPKTLRQLWMYGKEEGAT